MIAIDLVKGLFAQLALLSLMVAGFTLMIGGFWSGGRRWAGRFALLGILFAIVAGTVTPEWLP
jgi:hypothetical protein